MEISLTNLITNTLALTDETIVGFVAQAHDNIHNYLSHVIILVATVYVMVVSLKVLYQQAVPDVMGLARSLSFLVIIMVFTTHWEFYQRFVYDVFTIEPMHITRYLSGNAEDEASALNALWNDGCNAALLLWKYASIQNISYYFYSLFVLGATCITTIYALGLLVLAKMVLAVLLSIGPLFLLFLLFDATKELVTGWIKALLHYALIPIITTAILVLMSHLVEPTLTGLANSATQPKATGLIPYIGLSLVCHFLLKQVMSLSASLSGSIAIDGLNALSAMARSPLNTFQRLRGGHLDRQERRLRRGKDIGRDRIKRNWNSVKTKANAFRQRLVQGGRR